ncbi:MAG: hypothetical protein DBW64_04120 [PS1 clade bacterium]|uniref:Uncharacterized protein n=1 Tax=PS1 clade bacterium TaxID=2175152 RepID=A0A368EIN9_9PROT|nr:MAG: hypothetical protein DBW64_04120 [PS1 clade bacterium]
MHILPFRHNNDFAVLEKIYRSCGNIMIGLIMGIATCITGGIIISGYISGVISVVLAPHWCISLPIGTRSSAG